MDRLGAISSLHSFSTMDGIASGPIAFVGFKFISSLFTSGVSVVSRHNSGSMNCTMGGLGKFVLGSNILLR